MPNNGIHGPGFHHLALRAADFDATVRFYTEGLGFRRAYGWGEGDGRAVLLDVGDGNYLEVFGGGKAAEDPPEGAWLHVAFRVDDPAAALARAVEAGARTTMEPTVVPIAGDRPLTFHIAFCKGLNGEVIEFFSNEEL